MLSKHPNLEGGKALSKEVSILHELLLEGDLNDMIKTPTSNGIPEEMLNPIWLITVVVDLCMEGLTGWGPLGGIGRNGGPLPLSRGDR